MFAVIGCAGGDDVELAPDAAVVSVDAAATTPEVPRDCEVQLKDPTGINRGRAGGTGGGKGPVLACADVTNERIVGVAIRMSNQATIFGGRSAHGMQLACARVTVSGAGNAELGPVTTVDVSGLGTYDWSPSTWTAVTQCKAGWVVSGLRVHTGTNGNLFRDVSILCSQLAADGTIGTEAETIKVVGSLTDANGPDEVRCGSGEVVAQFGTWTGAGIDAVDLSCSRPACR
jgi:hypothetical protein